MNDEIILAPAPELVECLAIQRRAFACIHAWAADGDREGMLCGAWPADALHYDPPAAQSGWNGSRRT